MSYATYEKVREAFERKGRTLEMWCLDWRKNRSAVRSVLVNGPSDRLERALRDQVIRAAGLDPAEVC